MSDKAQNEYTKRFLDAYNHELSRGNLSEAFMNSIMKVASDTPESRIEKYKFYKKDKE